MILLALILTFILRVYFEKSSLIKYKRGIIIRGLIKGIRKAFIIGKSIKPKGDFFRVIIIRLKVLIFKIFFLSNPGFNLNYII